MRELVREGVRLCYEEAGRGDPPLVLVHGWCCDHTSFAPQVAHFQRRRRVIAVDLRGHGASAKPEQPYPIGGFADDVAWLCGQVGVEQAVVMGHSMGGVVAHDLAIRYRPLVAAVVMLDAPVVRPPASRQALPGLLDALRGPGYREALQRYVASSLFIPTDDAARQQSILEHMAAAPQHVIVAAMEGLRDYDAAAAGRCTVPALYIAANEPTPRSDLSQVRDLCPQLLYGQTVGSGHFLQLEVPEQVNAMVDRFLTLARVQKG